MGWIQIYLEVQSIANSLEVEKSQNLVFLNFEFSMIPESYKFHQKKLLREKVLRPVMLEEASKFTDTKTDSLKSVF